MSSDIADKLRQLRMPPDDAPPRVARAEPARPSARTRRAPPRALTMAAVAGVAGALGLWGGSLVADVAPAPVEAPAAAPEAASPDADGFNASGHVVARRQATIAAQTTGMINSIAVEEGQAVKAGDLIARLDARATVAGLDRAEAMAAAGAAATDALAARLREAEATERRFAALAERGFARAADLDKARAEVAALSADLRRARAQRAGEAADARAAAVSLDRLAIRAPFGGVVTRLSAQPGEIISPVSGGGGFTRTGICTIVDMDSLEVEVDVSESLIARIAPGQAAQITLQAYPGRRYPGRVIAVVPVADRARASFRVRVALDGRDARVLPEMAARVFFSQQG